MKFKSLSAILIVAHCVSVPPSHATGPVDRFLRRCERILAPQELGPVLESLHVLITKARSHYDLPHDYWIQALADKIDRLPDRDLPRVVSEIQPHLAWARASNPHFLRVLKWLLRHSVVETRHFVKTANREGASAAYAKYWARMDKIFQFEGAERVPFIEVIELTKETQKLMRTHPGPYREGPRAILGGSVINAQATRGSDLDGYIFPPHFLQIAFEHGKAPPAALGLFEEFDRRMVRNPYRSATEIFDRANLWGEIQPFALDITPEAIELVYFHNENSFSQSQDYTYRKFRLDW